VPAVRVLRAVAVFLAAAVVAVRFTVVFLAVAVVFLAVVFGLAFLVVGTLIRTSRGHRFFCRLLAGRRLVPGAKRFVP